LSRIFLIFLLTTVAARTWAQTDSNAQTPASGAQAASGQSVPSSDEANTAPAATDQGMVAPPILTGAASPLAFTSEMERSNYLRGGATASFAYNSNVINTEGNSTSDETYTISPFIDLDITRTRFRFSTIYSPGFTFYQHLTDRNQANQSLGLSFAYRLSPHVTFTAADSLAKTSTYTGLTFNTIAGVPNAIQSPNLAVVAPVADLLINTSNVGLSYQFGRNDMVGITGNSSILRYLNQSQAQGLYDSTGYGVGGYYTHRFGRNYLGVNYLFQDFTTETIQQKTKTDSIYGSYTFYLKPNLSLSAFGGPQYSDTSGPGTLPIKKWSPAGGGSVSWQGQQTSFAATFSHRITDGGGLPGAVTANSVNGSFRAQLTRTITGTLGAGYSSNTSLDPALQSQSNGNSASATVGLQRTFGEHFSGSVGYLYLHQSYTNIPVINVAPNQNQVWISVSYQFERPLGR
jgi:hypothetical protein